MIHNHSPPRKGLFVGRRIKFALPKGEGIYQVAEIGETTVRLEWVGGLRYPLVGAAGNVSKSVIEALVEVDDRLSPADKPH